MAIFSSLDKQILRSLSRRMPNRGTGPSIAIVGNCQAAGIAYSIKLLDHRILVNHFQLAPNTRIPLKLFAYILKRYDYVFTHEFSSREIMGCSSNELHNHLHNHELIPSITFSAFHPDLIYISEGVNNNLLTSPTGHYHSALVFFGWLNKYSVSQTLSLFNTEMMQTLGYFDFWPNASSSLKREGEKFGYNFDNPLISWSRKGIFMYSINHPKAYVLFDLAKLLLTKIGYTFNNSYGDDYLFDRLSGGEVFPVYTQIANYYGYTGNYLFRNSQFNIEKNNYEFIDLQEYTGRCFQIYDMSKSLNLRNDRVDSWLQNENIIYIAKHACRKN